LARRKLAFVEVVETGLGEALQRTGQRRQPHDLAGAPAPAVWAVDRCPARTTVVKVVGEREALRTDLDGLDVAIPGGKAAGGELDRRRQDCVAREAAVAGVCGTPGADGPGRRDRARPDERHGRDARFA